MPEIVYVLTNEAMPEIIKIGRTCDSVEARIRSLDSTNLPLPFECYFAAEVDNSNEIERLLHQLFSDHRIRPNREFFRLAPEKVVLALKIGRYKDVTPQQGIFESHEEEQAVVKARARRSRINLAAIGVPEGAVLTFSRDESVICKVIGESKVEFDGEITSLSAAALKVLHRMGYTTPACSGSDHWMYEGELLWERRMRVEVDKFSGDD